MLSSPEHGRLFQEQARMEQDILDTIRKVILGLLRARIHQLHKHIHPNWKNDPKWLSYIAWPDFGRLDLTQPILITNPKVLQPRLIRMLMQKQPSPLTTGTYKRPLLQHSQSLTRLEMCIEHFNHGDYAMFTTGIHQTHTSKSQNISGKYHILPEKILIDYNSLFRFSQ